MCLNQIWWSPFYRHVLILVLFYMQGTLNVSRLVKEKSLICWFCARLYDLPCISRSVASLCRGRLLIQPNLFHICPTWFDRICHIVGLWMCFSFFQLNIYQSCFTGILSFKMKERSYSCGAVQGSRRYTRLNKVRLKFFVVHFSYLSVPVHPWFLQGQWCLMNTLFFTNKL